MKSKSNMKSIINSKYPNAPEYKFPSEFISVSNAGFNSNSYKSYVDVAVHLAISTFNSIKGDETKSLVTHPISLNMIIDRLNVNASKSHLARARENIAQSLKNLEEAKIIHIQYLTDKNKSDPSSLFKVTQALVINSNGVGERRFSTVTHEVFEKMMLVEKDDERFKLMAVYMSIAYRIFPYKELKARESSQSTQSMISAFEKVVFFQKIETIGDYIKVKSHATIAKFINKLSDMELIAYYKVAAEGYQKNQWKFNISKFEDRKILKNYLIYKLDYQNDKFPIIDIYEDEDEEIQINEQYKKGA